MTPLLPTPTFTIFYNLREIRILDGGACHAGQGQNWPVHLRHPRVLMMGWDVQSPETLSLTLLPHSSALSISRRPCLSWPHSSSCCGALHPPRNGVREDQGRQSYRGDGRYGVSLCSRERCSFYHGRCGACFCYRCENLVCGSL